MQKEEQDVKNLEQTSIASLYHSIIGNKKQKLNAEQVEFFSAKLKFDSCQSSINSMKREIEGYQQQIDDCDKYEAEYIESIKNNPSQLTVDENIKLVESVDEIVQLKTNNIQVNEAIAAGRLAIEALKSVIEKMQSASTWGWIDIFAGGIIVTAIKHSKINQSQKLFEEANVYIEKFNRELSEIQTPINSDLKIDIGGFKKFADYFFDGIIFDWLVQSKIKKSLKAYVDTEAEISRIVLMLLEESSSAKQLVNAINHSKLDLFTN